MADILSEAEAEARLARAAARGQAQWPWPDLTQADCRAAFRQFERAAAAILAHGAAAEPLEGDAETIGIAGYISGMGPLLGHWIATGALGAAPGLAATLALHLEHNRARNARLTRECEGLVARLAAKGVGATLLKGIHTAAYFPDPATRPLSDLDLVVTDAEAANRLMAAEGAEPIGRNWFESTWRPAESARMPRTLAYNHRDDPWSIDLHSTLDRTVQLGRVLRFDRVAASLASSPERRLGAAVLPQPLLLLYLACHAGGSDFNSLTLLRLCELALVIRRDRQAGALDWTAFETAGAQAGALDIAYPALKLCEALAPGSVPEATLARCRAAMPRAAARFVDRLSPAEAQRLQRLSVTERYMWARNAREVARRLLGDLGRAPRLVRALGR